MALSLKADGLNPENLFTAAWVNDFTNLLKGAMTDQPVTLNYRPGAVTNTPSLALQGDGTHDLLRAYGSNNTTVVFSVSPAGNVVANGALTIAGAITGITTFSASGNGSVGGTLTITGLLTANGGITIVGNGSITGTFTAGNIALAGTITANGAASGMEFGSKSVAGTPYIDLNASGFGNDYDFRIVASGGVNGTSGKGTLNFAGGSLTFNGKPLIFGNSGLSGKFDAAATAPTSPADGDLWLDLSQVIG